MLEKPDEGNESDSTEVASKIFLMEYQALVQFETHYNDFVQKKLQFYFTVLSGAVAFFGLAYSQQLHLSISPLTPFFVLVLLLAIGFFSLFEIILYDLYRYNAAWKRETIQRKYATIVPASKEYFENPRLSSPLLGEHTYWTSSGGMLKRALLFGGPKTMLSLCNGAVGAVLFGFGASVFTSDWIFLTSSGLVGLVIILVAQLTYLRLRWEWGRPKEMDSAVVT